MSRELCNFARPAIDQTEKPPPAEAHYFYASSTSIDDPQAAVPPPVANPSAATRLPLRPLSDSDNAAVDKAWNKLRRNLLKYKEEKDASDSKAALAARSRASSSARAGGADFHKDPNRSQQAWQRSPRLDAVRGKHSRPGSSSDEESLVNLDIHSGSSPRPNSKLREMSTLIDSEPEEQGLTGRPFARAPSRSKLPTSQRQSLMVDEEQLEEDLRKTAEDEEKQRAPSVKIPVGVSKLHEVVMPDLQLDPIYWKPVNDISAVVRATWFYKDTMLPVETDAANMLERGYLDLRPWTDTWRDELNSAVEVGAIGEEKISHTLWPEDTPAQASSRPSTAVGSTGIVLNDQEDTPESRRRHVLDLTSQLIDVSTSGQDIDNKAAGSPSLGNDGQKRLYMGSQIIYVSEHEAYILRPSLAPSAYYGRRPLANYIRKSRKLGICVRRGFDRQAWIKLNPDSLEAKASKIAASEAAFKSFRPHSPGLYSEPTSSTATGGRVNDLILVIHGIGQKMAERVESFHFTHAMNSFRRELNVEMDLPQVKSHLRKDGGGVMILPVNWRSTLTFEDGGYKEAEDDSSQNRFTLKDITPDSLPAVRSVINDVCFDIPYYLDTKYGPKMNAAVIKEANRIYDIWCKNNPGFESYGRVHLLAHSLGSIMAVDILARQPTITNPTSAPPELDSSAAQHFNFDTKNLYICGSPVGFFLLLKQSSLLPRKDRNKPSSESDWAPGIAGSQGDYGCLAVDNIYNILNPYDPVAYRLNATLDTNYAASLKTAFVPSASTSWFRTATFRPPAPPQQAGKPTLTARLPSTVELETHNFTREEIAEKRAYLLNDNGQIDYFLRYGGGPLEIQYLTMLGAHSSYWLSRDFVRFLALETGREPGREGTLSSMRAVKKKAYA